MDVGFCQTAYPVFGLRTATAYGYATSQPTSMHYTGTMQIGAAAPQGRGRSLTACVYMHHVGVAVVVIFVCLFECAKFKDGRQRFR